MGIVKQLPATPQYLRHSFSLVVFSGALEITKTALGVQNPEQLQCQDHKL